MTELEEFHYGVAWYPEWGNESEWRSELDGIEAAGFTVVRIAEFAWEVFEPEPGVFDFRLYDEVMAELERRGLKVIFGIDTVRPPEWVFELYPDIHLTDDFGRFAPRRWPRHCFNHPAFKELSSRLIAQVVPRYAKSPAILYYQVDNEPCYQDHGIGGEHWFCYCVHCQGEFATWLETRYAGRKAPAISTPFPTQGEMGELAWLEWRQFHDDSIVRRAAWAREEVLRHDPSRNITTNVMVSSGFKSGASPIAHDVFRLTDAMDIMGMDFYPDMSSDGGEMDPLVFSISDQLSDGRGFHCLETQGTTYGVDGGHWDGQEAGFLEYGPAKRIHPQFWRTVAYGAQSLLYWVWRLRTDNVWALSNPDGSPRPVLEESRILSEQLAKVWPAIHDAKRPPAEVAVVFNRASEHLAHFHGVQGRTYTTSAHSQSMKSQNGDAVLNSFSAARRLTDTVDIVDVAAPGASLDGYRVVIAPFLYVVSRDEAAMLERFVSSGGTLIWGGRSGEIGESETGWQEISIGANLRLPVDGGLPSGLQEALGFRSRGAFVSKGVTLPQIQVGSSTITDPVDGGGWYRSIAPSPNADIVALTTAGTPGVLRNQHGAGTVWSILVDAFSGFDDAVVSLVEGIFLDSGLTAPFDPTGTIRSVTSRNEVIRRTTEAGEILFLINSSAEPWNVTVAAPAGRMTVLHGTGDLATGEVEGRPVILGAVPAYEAAIVAFFD